MPADGTFKLGYDLSQLESDGHRASLMARQHGAQIAKAHAAAAHEAKAAFKDFGRELLTTAAVPLSAMGAVEGLHRMAEHFESIAKTAKILDTTPEAVQRLGYIAAGTGTQFDLLVNGLSKTHRALLEVDNEAKSKALNNMGLDIESFMGLDADKQMIKLAHAFQEAQETGKGFTEIYDLLGKSAPELLPVLRGNISELEAMSRQAVASAASVELFEKNLAAVKMASMVATNGTGEFLATLSKIHGELTSGLAGMFGGDGFFAGFVGKAAETAEAEADEEKKQAEERDKRKKLEIERAKELAGWKKADRAEKQGDHEKGLAFSDPEMSAAEKLKTVKGELYEITHSQYIDEQRMAEDVGYRERMESRIIALKRESIDLARQAKKQAESTNDAENELRLLELKAQHRQGAVKKQEEANKLQKDFEQFRDQHPEKGEAWAMDMAKRKQRAEDRLAHPGNVHGPAEGAGKRDTFSGLAAMNARNALKWDELHPGLHPAKQEKKDDTWLNAQGRQTEHLKRIEQLLEEK